MLCNPKGVISMNKRKQLLVAIFAVVFFSPVFTEDNVNTPEQQKEIAELFETELYKDHYDKQLTAFDQCIRTSSDDCDLVIEHLKRARNYRAKVRDQKKAIEPQENMIVYLENQMITLPDDRQLKKPMQEMIDEATSACPDCFKPYKSYWGMLSESDRGKLAQAAKDLSLKRKEKYHVAHNIKMLHKSLNK